MTTLQQLQAPIDQRIAQALITATPDTWTRAEMTVERRLEDQAERLSIVISNPDGRREVVSASEEIQQELHRLVDCFKQAGARVWARAMYRVADEGDGRWRFSADFEY
ncbi:MAG: hypothetical protein EPO12_10810 [Aquabacterium sp.]|jgi:hypothetical protein|nr:MAG: hypothetical protein EPO12_10810 [Aquabacterium sp.]